MLGAPLAESRAANPAFARRATDEGNPGTVSGRIGHLDGAVLGIVRDGRGGVRQGRTVAGAAHPVRVSAGSLAGPRPRRRRRSRRDRHSPRGGRDPGGGVPGAVRDVLGVRARGSRDVLARAGAQPDHPRGGGRSRPRPSPQHALLASHHPLPRHDPPECHGRRARDHPGPRDAGTDVHLRVRRARARDLLVPLSRSNRCPRAHGARRDVHRRAEPPAQRLPAPDRRRRANPGSGPSRDRAGLPARVLPRLHGHRRPAEPRSRPPTRIPRRSSGACIATTTRRSGVPTSSS